MASTVPASRPAAGVDHRRTAATSSATLATPASACGTRIAHEFRPKTRTDRPVSHTDAGVLSTVIELAESVAPKNHADQLCEPACAAAE